MDIKNCKELQKKFDNFKKVSKRKIALLSAAYSLSEETVRNLNGKMMGMFGPKKSLDVMIKMKKYLNGLYGFENMNKES